jgi:uncharacterized repeat protein (TIGR03803 family)
VGTRPLREAAMKNRFITIIAALLAFWSLGAISRTFGEVLLQPIAGFFISQQNQSSGLASDGAGNLYSATSIGGKNNAGSVFKVSTVSGTTTRIADFDSSYLSSDSQRGSDPLGGLVSDGVGYLWGTTYGGGESHDGTVYKINISTGAISTIVDFDDQNISTDNHRGGSPAAGLVSDGEGNLWGTTGYGGTDNDGTVFRINISTGSITTIADFDRNNSASDNQRGAFPQASLVSDAAGNLWGTTEAGGVNSLGTVFKINTTSGVMHTIVDFDNSTSISDNQRGAEPEAALVNDGQGNLWGTTDGGGGNGKGTVFKINISTGTITTVVDFDKSSSAADSQRGAFPQAGLAADGAGDLWGTTSSGGEKGDGTVFKINISSAAITTVFDFDGSTSVADYLRGGNPEAGLFRDASGNLWGTTSEEGGNGYGTVFEINTSNNSINTVADIGIPEPAYPTGGMTDDGSGSIWGASLAGGANGVGTVFKINKLTNAIATIVTFDGTSASTDNFRGSSPQSGLASDGTGNLWGTTGAGGVNNYGTVFKISGSTGAITTILDFDNSSSTSDSHRGGNPLAGLVSDGTGNFWGTTDEGGAYEDGVIFKVNITTGAMTTVADFDGSSSPTDNQRGNGPEARLASDGAGNLWGTTFTGGVNGDGTVFKINISTGTITTVVDFDASLSGTDNQRGSFPEAELVNDGAGYMWGTTYQGGVTGVGTIFKVNISSGVITTLVDFDASFGSGDNQRGGYPIAGLASDGMGNLWGTTSSQGENSDGTIFKVNTSTGSISTLFDFGQKSGPYMDEGERAVGTLVFTGTGFYGSTRLGGVTPNGIASQAGEIFYVGPPTPPVASDEAILERGFGSLVIDVLTGDSDPAGTALTVTGLTRPSFGTAVITGSGTTITYTPAKTFAGTDTFTYTIANSAGATTTGTITIYNPFLLQAGSYAGVLNNPGGGYLSLATTGAGTFTGRLKVGNLNYTLLGTFAADGSWSGTLGGKTTALQLNIGSVVASGTEEHAITGFCDGIAFAAYLDRYNGTTNPAPEVGTYKILIAPPAQTGTMQAIANAVIANSVITGINVTGSGLGYISIPAVTVSATSGRGAVLTATVSNGQVTGIKVVRGGTKYPATGMTVNIAPPSGNPIGIGYATLTVTKLGTATLTGRLADGRPFTDALLITDGTGSADTVQVYISLPYHVAGLLAGTLTFKDEPGISDLDGTLSWIRPQQVGSAIALFQGGFSLDTTAIGSLYALSKGAPALAVSTASPNATITLDETGWSAPIVKQVTVATNNKVTINNPGADKLALVISAPGGAFSGSFIDPATGKRQAFTGLLFQKQTGAGGYFVNTTESGLISLSP